MSTGASFITVEGRRVRFAVDGDPANPPVVLVHGIGRSLEDWDELTQRLVADYRVIRMDTPGFGYSDPMPGPVVHEALGRGIASALVEIGETRPVHAIGNSLGGSVIMEFAAAYPERVRSLTLVNSAAFGATVTPLLRMLAVPGLGWVATRHTSKSAAKMLEESIFVDHSMVTPARIAHAVEIGNLPGNGTFMYRMVRHLGTWRGVRGEWRARLLRDASRFAGPVMVIWGDRDKVLPVAHMENALKTFPSAQSHLFQGVGHMPQVEVPDEAARVIREFLAGA